MTDVDVTPVRRPERPRGRRGRCTLLPEPERWSTMYAFDARVPSAVSAGDGARAGRPLTSGIVEAPAYADEHVEDQPETHDRVRTY